MNKPRRGMRTAWLAFAAMTTLLAACQTTPPPGQAIVAEVVAVPRTRAELARGATQGDLHAALRAGATPAHAADRRLALASCARPDPAAPGGARLYTVTTLVPAGTTWAPGARLRLRVAADAFSAPPLQGRYPAVHAEFVAADPATAALDASTGVPWRLRPEDPPRLQVNCLPPGAAAGLAAAAFFRTVGETEMRFAAAEAARYAQFSDAELAAGAVVRVRCRLKMVDGAEWHTPEFVARAPARLALAPGDVVRLRAGTDEGSLQPGAPGEVLERQAARSAAGGVPCHR